MAECLWTQMNYKPENPWYYKMNVDIEDETDFLWIVETQLPPERWGKGRLQITEEEFKAYSKAGYDYLSGNYFIYCDEDGNDTIKIPDYEFYEYIYFVTKAILRRYGLEHIFDPRCI